MANKHTNKYTCLVIRKMQVRTTRRYYLTPTRRAGIKQNKNGKEQVLVRKWGKLETCVCVAGAGDVCSFAKTSIPLLLERMENPCPYRFSYTNVHRTPDSHAGRRRWPHQQTDNCGGSPRAPGTHTAHVKERSSDTCYGLCEP